MKKALGLLVFILSSAVAAQNVLFEVTCQREVSINEAIPYVHVVIKPTVRAGGLQQTLDDLIRNLKLCFAMVEWMPEIPVLLDFDSSGSGPVGQRLMRLMLSASADHWREYLGPTWRRVQFFHFQVPGLTAVPPVVFAAGALEECVFFGADIANDDSDIAVLQEWGHRIIFRQAIAAAMAVSA